MPADVDALLALALGQAGRQQRGGVHPPQAEATLMTSSTLPLNCDMLMSCAAGGWRQEGPCGWNRQKGGQPWCRMHSQLLSAAQRAAPLALPTPALAAAPVRRPAAPHPAVDGLDGVVVEAALGGSGAATKQRARGLQHRGWRSKRCNAMWARRRGACSGSVHPSSLPGPHFHTELVTHSLATAARLLTITWRPRAAGTRAAAAAGRRRAPVQKAARVLAATRALARTVLAVAAQVALAILCGGREEGSWGGRLGCLAAEIWALGDRLAGMHGPGRAGAGACVGAGAHQARRGMGRLWGTARSTDRGPRSS